MQATQHTRRYDLDWLRIGAFALLVPFHVGMYYVTWDWHIKSPAMSHTLEPFMFLTVPWRMSLLFLISGVALAHAMRYRNKGLMWSRSKRLLLPLFFGMFCVVVPQVYLELKEKMPGFDMSPSAFYLRYLQGGDIYCMKPHDCVDAPTWNHLWFVAYLWTYSMIWCLVSALTPDKIKTLIASKCSSLLSGAGCILIPIVFLGISRVYLYPIFDSSHDLLDDWYNHAQYGLAFVMGIALAFNEKAWTKIYSLRWKMTAIWAICFIGFLAYFVNLEPVEETLPAIVLNAERFLWGLMTWAAICAVAGHATRLRNTDNRWRAWLTEAVFPLYILHQTVIIILAWEFRAFHLPWQLEYLVLIVLTFAICLFAFECIRRVSFLRPLFGLKRQKSLPRLGLTNELHDRQVPDPTQDNCGVSRGRDFLLKSRNIS